MQHAMEIPASETEVGPAARANALRVLAVDAIARARSGHAGTPLGMADVAEVLWTRYLRHDPRCPSWWDRDRFVLSSGHGSMLLYALLHLTGYDLPRRELERFRQLGSLAPGHPDHDLTPGVEATTGPLAHGLANAVGMALAEKLLAAEFNRPGFPVIDHHTYVLLGDGCLMEGLSHEAASLAGALRLGKLVCFWEDDGLSVDGRAGGWFRDDTAARFEAYGWQVVRGVDGHDPDDVAAAIAVARSDRRRPALVCCRTVLGKGLPARAGTPDAHGAPVCADEARTLRQALGWSPAPFEVPEGVRASWDFREGGAALRGEWQGRFDAYARAYPELAAELRRRMAGELPAAYPREMARALEEAAARREVVATRKASQDAIELLARVLPELVGGSADLSAANLTRWRDAEPVGAEGGGRYVHWGARELGMAAALNGLALHGGFLPYAGTYLALSDHARAAMRLAALSSLRAVFVLTHDSIGVGEDGPTHQPVEHAASLRLVPGLDVWRPCDAFETFVAWRAAVDRRHGPTALLLSRQALPAQPRDRAAMRTAERGGYVLAEAEGGAPRAVIVATGSEVQLAMSAQRLLADAGVPVRVVSMPCTSAFDRQDPEWRAEVLPPGVPRVAVEAGASAGWWRYVGFEGAVVGVDRFGESGPMEELFRELGLTPERIARVVLSVAGRRRRRAPRAARAHQRH
ncbi:MAG TPA: transketolase [Anaeromyxobacter sp.]|nr:transketolase [Anaeromyxobacter sp.]